MASLTERQLNRILEPLQRPMRHRGRPWALSLRRRVVIACTSRRTNLTMRERSASLAVSRSQVHRIVVDITQRLARMVASSVDADRRRSWVVDETLVPTREHAVAAKSKNDRWACNAQILIRRVDLHVVAVAGGGPGNRNDPVHYKDTVIEALCQHHGRVLADGGYRGVPELKHRYSSATGSYATPHGGGIESVVHASSTRSPSSRTGVCYGTTSAEHPASSYRCKPSRSCTISGSNFETALTRVLA